MVGLFIKSRMFFKKVDISKKIFEQIEQYDLREKANESGQLPMFLHNFLKKISFL